MKQNSEKDSSPARRSSPAKTSAIVAGILAIVQACLTIEGRGIEGFVLWVILLFLGYWLLFTGLLWLWGKRKDRA